ncbi:MAG TPA: pyridoxal 5'-phosphate synthase glutaminase subunit PdxT [Chloroflexia bacterium]|nr:pyridoxal 5'-phosphate synthase glutaminase subunit PdxT [Chloroflexia bacterium]
MKIGVLALQGAFREHIEALTALGVDSVEVRLPEQLDGLDGLIIPGGESTAIGKLAVKYGLQEAIRRYAEMGKPVYGTCAGMILLSNDIGREQPLLGVMNVKVERNAFGRQLDSFETGISIPALGEAPFPGVFIRAPKIESVGEGVEVLAELPDGTPVAARQDNMLVTAFHPELTDDLRFHRYFMAMVESHNRQKQGAVTGPATFTAQTTHTR